MGRGPAGRRALPAPAPRHGTNEKAHSESGLFLERAHTLLQPVRPRSRALIARAVGMLDRIIINPGFRKARTRARARWAWGGACLSRAGFGRPHGVAVARAGAGGSAAVSVPGGRAPGLRPASELRFQCFEAFHGPGKGTPAKPNCRSLAGCRGLPVGSGPYLSPARDARNSAGRSPGARPAVDATVAIPSRPRPHFAGSRSTGFRGANERPGPFVAADKPQIKPNDPPHRLAPATDYKSPARSSTKYGLVGTPRARVYGPVYRAPRGGEAPGAVPKCEASSRRHCCKARSAGREPFLNAPQPPRRHSRQ